MTVYAHYDSSGTIHALVVVNAPEGTSPMLTPKPGLFVAEIEGEVEGLNLNPEAADADLETLRTVIQNLRVATPIPRCRLAPKP